MLVKKLIDFGETGDNVTPEGSDDIRQAEAAAVAAPAEAVWPEFDFNTSDDFIFF